MNKFIKRPIVFVLIVFFILSSVLTTLVFVNMRLKRCNEALTQEKLLVKSFSDYIKSYIGDHKEMITASSKSKGMEIVIKRDTVKQKYRGLSELSSRKQREYIKDILKLNDNFLALGLIDVKSGKNLLIEPYYLQKKLTINDYNKGFKNKDWYKNVIKTKKTVISRAYLPYTVKHPVAVIATPIFDKNKKPTFIYIGVLKLWGMHSISKGFSNGKTGVAYVVDDKGNIIIHPKNKMKTKGSLTNLYSSTLIKRAILSNTKVRTGEFKDPLSKKTVLAAYKRVNGAKWYVVAQVSKDEILKNMFISDILARLVILLLVFGTATYILNHKLKYKLAEETAQLTATIDALPDMLFEVDENGVILDYRAPNREIAYQQPKSFIGKKMDNFIPKTELEKIYEGFKQSSQNKNVNELDMSPQFLYGDSWYELSIAAKENNITSKKTFIILVRDITYRKVSEIALRQSEARAEAANKAKSEFIANMSHEIRTPLNAIIGLNSILLQSATNSKQYDFLQKIQYSADNLLGLINDILDFSKLEVDKVELFQEEFDFFELLNNIGNIFYNDISNKGLRLKILCDEEIPFLLVGDKKKISGILINLIGNAVKFTKEGSISIHVAVAYKYGEDIIIKLSVKDTGIGIKEEHKELLFKPFSQGNVSISKEYGGTGLGLAICKKLVQKMNGEISFKSQVGIGTEFICTMCLLTLENPKKAMEKGKLWENKKIVLNIKDREILFNIKRMLDTLGVSYINENDESATIDFSLDISLWIFDIEFIKQHCLNMTDEEYSNFNYNKKTIIIGGFNSDRHTIEDVLSKGSHLIMYPMGLRQLTDAFSYAFNEKANYLEETKLSSSLKVLIVEDNDINMLVTEECFFSANVKPKKAKSGLRAIQMLKEEYFDIILMDIHMPDLDGIETTKRIRKLKNGVATIIIALTADIEMNVRKEAYNAGINDFVLKPFKQKELLSVINKWCERSNLVGLQKEKNKLDNDDKKILNLPKILPGINVVASIERLNGNVETYIDILKLFTNNKGSILEIREALTKHDYYTALRFAHTLKGVSGNIGAINLFNIAAEAESLIKNKEDIELIEKVLLKIEEELKIALKSAGELIRKFNDKKEPKVVNLDVNSKLNELLTLIELNDIDALNLYKEISSELSEVFGEIDNKGLKQAIETFDWEKARRILLLNL